MRGNGDGTVLQLNDAVLSIHILCNSFYHLIREPGFECHALYWWNISQTIIVYVLYLLGNWPFFTAYGTLIQNLEPSQPTLMYVFFVFHSLLLDNFQSVSMYTKTINFQMKLFTHFTFTSQAVLMYCFAFWLLNYILVFIKMLPCHILRIKFTFSEVGFPEMSVSLQWLTHFNCSLNKGELKIGKDLEDHLQRLCSFDKKTSFS